MINMLREIEGGREKEKGGGEGGRGGKREHMNISRSIKTPMLLTILNIG